MDCNRQSELIEDGVRNLIPWLHRRPIFMKSPEHLSRYRAGTMVVLLAPSERS